jgi:hypothetical protein
LWEHGKPSGHNQGYDRPQVVFVAYDLFAPFYSPIFNTFTTMDFLIAYLTAVLDVIILIGFYMGSKWVWFF